MSYTPDDPIGDAEIPLPDSQVADVAIHFIRSSYRRVSEVELPADRHQWMVVHDADGSFKDRAIYRSVIEELDKLATKLTTPLDQLVHGLAYDGETNQLVSMQLQPYNRDAPGWPRLILARPGVPYLDTLVAQILDDVENGGNGDMALADTYVEEELEREALENWADMTIAERMDLIERAREGDPIEALCEEGPSTGAVYAELERHIYESS